MGEELPNFSFGMRLRMARMQSRVPSSWLAERFGVSLSTLAAWQNDQKYPKDALHVVEVWSDVTGVDKHWLGFGEVLRCERCGNTYETKSTRRVVRSA